MTHERGTTLIVTLIMLILMTLAAVTAFNMGRGNLLVINNQQHRDEAKASAVAALEEVLSKTAFSDTPESPFGTTNSKSYDVNGDGNADISVKVGNTADSNNPKPCIKSFTVLPADPNDTTSLGCASGVQQQFGIEGANTWGAQCADIIWDVTAVAEDSATNAKVTAVMGIRVREDANKTVSTTNYCE